MLALVGAATLAGCAGPAGLECDAPGVVIEPMGVPAWRMTTPVAFSAPYDDGELLVQTVRRLFPNPLWGLESGGRIVAGNPSSQPFDTYVQDQVAELGWDTGPVFSTSQFSGGPAVYIAFLLLPAEGATMGRSSDSPDEDVPIIPHSLYGFGGGGSVLRDCEVFDPGRELRWDAPPPSAGAFDGQSRIAVLLIDSYDLRLPESDAVPEGTYLHEQTIRDTVGAGYRFSVQFEVE